MAGALSGLKVLDCTHVIAGLGADVIKIENPEGEQTRDSPARP